MATSRLIAIFLRCPHGTRDNGALSVSSLTIGSHLWGLHKGSALVTLNPPRATPHSHITLWSQFPCTIHSVAQNSQYFSGSVSKQRKKSECLGLWRRLAWRFMMPMQKQQMGPAQGTGWADCSMFITKNIYTSRLCEGRQHGSQSKVTCRINLRNSVQTHTKVEGETTP